jgi:hypothetical protein
VTPILAPAAGIRSHRACGTITLWAVLMTDAPMTTDPSRLLKPDEAAAFLGLQPCTLAAWREDGSMPSLAFFNIGKAVRYRYGDVLAFIETRRATSTLAARALKAQGKVSTSDAAARGPLQKASRPQTRKRIARRGPASDSQQSLL